jgi:hypothetical protein
MLVQDLVFVQDTSTEHAEVPRGKRKSNVALWTENETAGGSQGLRLQGLRLEPWRHRDSGRQPRVSCHLLAPSPPCAGGDAPSPPCASHMPSPCTISSSVKRANGGSTHRGERDMQRHLGR